MHQELPVPVRAHRLALGRGGADPAAVQRLPEPGGPLLIRHPGVQCRRGLQALHRQECHVTHSSALLLAHPARALHCRRMLRGQSFSSLFSLADDLAHYIISILVFLGPSSPQTKRVLFSLADDLAHYIINFFFTSNSIHFYLSFQMKKTTRVEYCSSQTRL